MHADEFATEVYRERLQQNGSFIKPAAINAFARTGKLL
jgi:hypothetical protein